MDPRTQATYTLPIGDKNLSIQIRNLAEQANGSVLARFGDTMVHATAVMSSRDKANMGFFPLMVDYEEKYYAAGKIKGPRYIKREGRPTDEAVCNSRLIDRTIRPLFPKELRREVQTIATVLSWDAVNEPDVLALIGVSTALAISDIPWNGPVAAVRVGLIEGQYIINPTYEQRVKSPLDAVFSVMRKKGELLINMMEGGFNETSEQSIVEAYKFAKPYLEQIINFEQQIVEAQGKKKFELPVADGVDKEFAQFVEKKLEKLDEALYKPLKTQRQEAMDILRAELATSVAEIYPEEAQKLVRANEIFDEVTDRVLHENVLKHDKRPDGRRLDEIRPLYGEVGLIPRSHGSGFFSRGETKALSVATLGAPGDSQLMDGMEITGKKRFLHHYNFPPYSTGEVKFLRAPSRREIGHGMLAEKTLLPLMPAVEDFPYTIRVTSEILSSNGSTSMAALSAATMAIMDAGIPLKRPATGISLGLITGENGAYKILTDIQGPEDHHGDMDFKVAGTREGVNMIQMDVKIEGITEKILADVLDRGRVARNHILDAIEQVIAKPRPELSKYAPRILIIHIDPEKIREVIGPGGKIINEIIEQTGVLIDIEEDGTIFVTAENPEAGAKAVEWINNITREVKVGEVFQGKVKRIMAFGAFVEILPGQEGMIHVSNLADHRVNKVEDVVKIGDMVPVKVIKIDDMGRIDLSLKEGLKEMEKAGK